MLPVRDFTFLWVSTGKQQSDGGNRQDASPLTPIPRLLASEELTFHHGVECFPEVRSGCSGSVGIWFLPLALLLCCKPNPPQFNPQGPCMGKEQHFHLSVGLMLGCFLRTSSKAELRCTLVFQISHGGSWTRTVGNWAGPLQLWVWKLGGGHDIGSCPGRLLSRVALSSLPLLSGEVPLVCLF